jgi:hypothetical protein
MPVSQEHSSSSTPLKQSLNCVYSISMIKLVACESLGAAKDIRFEQRGQESSPLESVLSFFAGVDSGVVLTHLGKV